MGNMDAWDLALLVAAAMVAVSMLVRLMRRRRDQMAVRLRHQAARQKRIEQAKQAKQAKKKPADNDSGQ